MAGPARPVVGLLNWARGRDHGLCHFADETVASPKFIEFDGKRLSLREDRRPVPERTAAERYREPSLLSLPERED